MVSTDGIQDPEHGLARRPALTRACTDIEYFLQHTISFNARDFARRFGSTYLRLLDRRQVELSIETEREEMMSNYMRKQGLLNPPPLKDDRLVMLTIYPRTRCDCHHLCPCFWEATEQARSAPKRQQDITWRMTKGAGHHYQYWALPLSL